MIFALLSNLKQHGATPGGKLSAPLRALALVAFSGLVATYTFSGELSDIMNEGGVRRELATESEGQKGRRLKAERELDGRVLEVIKETWPECVRQRMNGIHCKNFIDEEILTLFTGDDRMTRTFIKGKRSIMDFFYNSVVIYMDDDDIVTGRDGDGLIYYDFEWLGSGEYATPEQQAEIPPIIATETCTNDDDEPLLFEEEPVLVEGATLDGALDGTDTNPIAGGVVTCPGSPNRNLDEDPNCSPLTWEERLAETQALTVVPPAGGRDLPAFDCTCLSGYNCCLLIKAMVLDSDEYGKAIQCHLNYYANTTKYEKFHTGRGKVVQIYTNHNFVVNKVPFVEGSWPGELTDDNPNEDPIRGY